MSLTANNHEGAEPAIVECSGRMDGAIWWWSDPDPGLRSALARQVYGRTSAHCDRPKGPPGPWTHHVHLMEPTAVRWSEQLLFRDYLRAHPEVAQEYGQLKRTFATAVGDDDVGFRAGKPPFIQ